MKWTGISFRELSGDVSGKEGITSEQTINTNSF